MFHYFTLEEVYAYAEKKGFKREDVEIEKIDGEVHGAYYEVSFGSQWYQLWTWEFESLDQPAVDYYYEECEAEKLHIFPKKISKKVLTNPETSCII